MNFIIKSNISFKSQTNSTHRFFHFDHLHKTGFINITNLTSNIDFFTFNLKRLVFFNLV